MGSYIPSFGAADAKYKRAQEHRRDLTDLIENALSDDSCKTRVFGAATPTPGEYRFHVVSLPPERLLEAIGVILGDCVHNLRSALDHAAWQVVLDSLDGIEPKDARLIQFPIYETPDGFEKTPCVRYLRPEYRRTIEEFQPYNGGPPEMKWKLNEERLHPLTWLRCISNADKHRMVMPLPLAPYDFTPIQLHGCHAVAVSVRGGIVLEEGAEFMTISYSPPPTLERPLSTLVTPLVTLPDGAHLTDALHEMEAMVFQLVSRLRFASWGPDHMHNPKWNPQLFDPLQPPRL